MSILVNRETKIIVQGITGQAGGFHTERMLEYGTKVVAGVTPGKGGSAINGVPVFNTMRQAVEATGANASILFVPAPFALGAVEEAIDAGVSLIVTITEGIPTLDMVKVKERLQGRSTCLIGPNCPGLTTPNECKLGIIPGYIHKRGPVGVISRSGTLTYDAVWQLTSVGLGQSTCIGIGGDPVVGTGFVELLKRFAEDEETQAVALIGEIGGEEEEQVAQYLTKARFPKPVVAFISGQTAPPEKRMGHAGAIISGSRGQAADKIAALRAAGVTVTETPAAIGQTMLQVMTERHVL